MYRGIFRAAFLALCALAGLRGQDTWTTIATPTAQGLWSVAWGGNQFVAVGEGGTILTSPDGLTWTPRDSGTTRWLVGVHYSRGQFVAVGEAAIALYSYDGVTWNLAHSLFNESPPERLNVARRFLDQFVALGENNAYAVASRSLLPGWQFSGAPGMPGKWWRGLAFARGVYVAAGAPGLASGPTPSSVTVDAAVRTPPSVRDMEDVIFAPEQFVAVGANGTVARSADGNTWAVGTAGVTEALRGVTFFNHRYVAAGAGGRIVTSFDGAAWMPQASGTTEELHAIGNSDTVVIAVGDHGRILRATPTIAAPAIVESPAAQMEEAGGNILLRVRATGGGEFSYVWRKNGVVVAGAASDTLLLANLQASDAGSYSVAVSTAAGSATSDPALVTVAPRAGAGVVDESFQVSPALTAMPTALRPLADGRLLLALDRAAPLASAVTRLRNDGSPDPTFQPVTVDQVTCLAFAADGGIYVGGNFSTANGEPRPRLIRLLPDGGIDPAFNAAAAATTAAITNLAVQADGRLLVANRSKVIFRLLGDGRLDPGFASPVLRHPGAAEDYGLTLVALAADGKIMVAGTALLSFSNIAGVRRLNADGSLDVSFPEQTAGHFPTALRVLSDGRIAFAASSVHPGLGFSFGRHLRRYRADGTTEFSSDLPGMPLIQGYMTVGWRDAVIYPDGRFLVSSDFTSVDGVPRGGLARLNADASLDPTFFPGVVPPEPVTKLAVAADGKIYAAGNFTFFDGRVRPRLVRLHENSTAEGIHVPSAVTLTASAPTVRTNQTLTLRATAAGSGPFTYQWFRQSSATPIAVTAEPTLTVTQTASGNGFFTTDLYTVKAVNFRGELTSDPIPIVALPAEPQIVRSPPSLAAQTGRALVISVDVNDPLTRQTGVFEWRRNGVLVGMPQSGRLEIPSVTPAVAGTYTVTVHDEGGLSVTSAPFVITVDDTARFANLSVRAQVGTGDRTIIAGFVIDSDPQVSRQILVRGVGPSLVHYGVAHPLANPRIALFNHAGQQVGFNDDWSQGNGSVSLAEMAAVGAFAFDPGSKDAATNGFLEPGSYTVQLTAATPGDTGEALIEVYEADNQSHRILNFSCRTYIDATAALTIPGLAIRGPVPKKMLVRAVGPGLAQFDVQERMADPVLSLRDDRGVEIASNNDWGTNAAEISAVNKRVGAFPFADGSKDAALVVTVPPGNYTAFVSGAGGTSGIVLVEVYEVP